MRASVLLAPLLLASSLAHADRVPAQIPIALDKAKAETYFQRAAKLFRKQFDHKALRTIADELSHGGEVNTKTVNQLKRMRKTGAIVRSLFVSLGHDHEEPKGVGHLIREFGKLNDAVEGEIKSAIPERAKDFLHQLDGDKRERVEAELEGFKAAGHESLAAFLDQTLVGLARDEHSATVEAERFHEIRKEMKHLMNLFGLMAKGHDRDAPVAVAFRHLFKINDELGKVHDDLVHRSMRGELDYEHAQVKVPDEVRETIRDLRAALVVAKD